MRPPRGRAARQQAEDAGRQAETQAVWLLRFKGYRIVARRQQTPVGELDIVARRGAMLAFVEVKRRPTLTQAAEAIDQRQRQHIARAAEAYLAAHPGLAGLDARFDAILVAPGRLPVHIANAWHIMVEI
ncbi:MAG: YraN family protein [Alphaproteobacteria bacterium]|nr:YraN family protein [Alphaproteobacteria bacterium]MDP7429127.1 YraN family protein [Alphaproteobacteria bacterium]